MARRRKGNPIDGIVILDKPQGLTSNAALQRVKRILNAAKAGHTGALDPLATGVLPLCFGEATKFSQYLLDADKEYVTVAKLGEKTSTADAEGEIVASSSVPESLDKFLIEAYLRQFRGELDQIPSMYSALKHQGTPLYKLARQGKTVERKPRKVTIFELEMLDWQSPWLTLRVKCSKGTYIRNLVEDIGDAIGCYAHVTLLRRTRSGPYKIEDAINLAQQQDSDEGQNLAETESVNLLLETSLLPVDTAVSGFPQIFLNQVQSDSLIHGQTVKMSPLENQGLLNIPLRLYREADNKFLGLGQIVDQSLLKSIRLISVSSS